MSPGDQSIDAPKEVLDSLGSTADEERDLFSRVVACCAVVTTLLAAVVALLHADASRHDDAAATQAQLAAIHASRATEQSRSDAHDEFRRLEAALEAEVQERNAIERELWGAGSEALGLDHRRWRRIASDAVDDVSPALRRDLRLDPYFPWSFLSRAERDGAYFAARRDTLSELSAQWGKRATTYIAILTILAVALYLFGFSLAPQGEHMRGVFATFGAVFLLVGFVFGPIQYPFPPRAPTTAVASHFAEGQVELDTGNSSNQYLNAERHFRAAIQARPRFARAYVAAADAHSFASTPQSATFVSLEPTRSRLQVTSDLERARELGLGSASVVGTLGFELWALGLATDREDREARGVRFTREAIRLDPEEPVMRFNLGAALLASGQTERAVEAYREALRRAFASSRYGPYGTAWLSGALTDLELVRRYAPIELAPDIRAVKELLVASFERNEVRRPGRAGQLTGVSLRVHPGYLEFGYETASGVDLFDVSAHYYRLEPGLGWGHLGAVSGSLFLDDAGNPQPFASYTKWSVPPACLPAGRYRVELYSKGRLVGEAQSDSAERGFVAFNDRGTGVAGCRPRSLKALRAPGLRFGVGYGRVANDPLAGALWFARLNDLTPTSGSGGVESVKTTVSMVVERASSRLGLRLQPNSAPDADLMELEAQVLRGYRYHGGRLWAAAGRDWDGSIVVALTLGPDSWFRNEDQVGMLRSLANRYLYTEELDL